MSGDPRGVREFIVRHKIQSQGAKPVLVARPWLALSFVRYFGKAYINILYSLGLRASKESCAGRPTDPFMDLSKYNLPGKGILPAVEP